MQKKFLFLLGCCISGATGSAQHLQLSHDGKTYVAGSVVEIMAKEITEILPGENGEPDLTLTKVTAGQDGPYVIHASGAAVGHYEAVISVSDDPTSYIWCGISHGVCAPLSGPTERRSGALGEGGRDPLLLEPAFTTGIYTTRTAELTLSVNGEPDAVFTLRYVYKKPTRTAFPFYRKGGIADKNCYDLSGMRVRSPRPGQLYLQARCKKIM